MQVSVGLASGVIRYDYTLRSEHAEMRRRVGLNVRRTIVVVFCARPADAVDHSAFPGRLSDVCADTTSGAQAIGYDKPHFQLEQIGACRFASIWLTRNIHTGQDFLTHSPSQLFFAQNIAMMVQSSLRTV